MLKIREVIVVEGRYDKHAVSSAVDATVIETSGFSIFSDAEKIKLLRRLAEKRGLVVLTDSDAAGFLIRGRLKGMLGGCNIKHAYVPDIPGRERRKRTPSAEGKLGVEAMDRKTIISALIRAGATVDDRPALPERADAITKADLFEAGLVGSFGCTERRRRLLTKLGLPERLNPNAMLDVLNALYTREEFLSLLDN